MTDEAPPPPTEEPTDAEKITSLSERLRFFFSDANLRQDRWMRLELQKHPSLSLDTLMRFKTIKNITQDVELLRRAARGEDATFGERLKALIVLDEERGEVRRVVPFDWKTMGDGSKLSLWVKNIPLTEPEKKKKDDDEEGREEEDDEGKKKEEDVQFKPRYAVTREEVKALFEPYGRVGIVNLRYGRKQSDGDKRSEAFPLGAAVVEFEDEEGINNAIANLLPRESEDDYDDNKGEEREENGDEKEADGDKESNGDEQEVDGDKKKESNGDEKKAGGDTKKTEPKTVLELKGKKLSVKRMPPLKFFQTEDGKNKRSRDSSCDKKNDDEAPRKEEEKEEIEFEPVTVEWEKGCIISLTGLNCEKCDRESIREAVSDILGVSKDVKTSGLYVDYNRGATEGKLRLKDASKSAEMKQLVDKLCDGTVLIADEKVGSAKVLEGEEEEQYWKEFIGFLNNRKRQREEEKAQNRKRQKRFSGGRGGGGRGRGRGRGRR